MSKVETEIPFYLLPNEQVTTQEIGKFDLFDFQTLEQKYDVKTPTVFESFGNSFDSAGDYVWDGVTGAWVSAKSAVNEGIASLGSAAGDIYNVLKTELIIWLGVALLVVWVVAKSGILVQAAPFVV